MTHTADHTDDRVRSTACAFGHHRYCRHADDYCTCECHDEPATADNTDRQENAAMSEPYDWADDPDLTEAQTRAQFEALSEVERQDDFFVPDEPLADVLAAFEAGQRGITMPPVMTGRPPVPSSVDGTGTSSEERA